MEFNIDFLGMYFSSEEMTFTAWVFSVGDGGVDHDQWNLILFGLFLGKPVLELFGFHIFGLREYKA